MTIDLRPSAPERTGAPRVAPVRPAAPAPTAPVRPATVHRGSRAGRWLDRLRTSAPRRADRAGTPVRRAALTAPAALVHQPAAAPVQSTPAAPVQPAARTGAAAPVHQGGGWLHRFRTRRTSAGDAPRTTPADPVRFAPVAPVQPTSTAPGRTSDTGAAEWGKLTTNLTPWQRRSLSAILVLVGLGLVAVIAAPPALSAHEIVAWAKLDTPEAGVGLTHRWAWFAFLALDVAAAVCVLVCLFCALTNRKPGAFALYVWLFAGATAYATHSYGSRPGAPGDASWFVPLMSVMGPVLLHSTLHKARTWIREAAGGKRSTRPTFPLVDWLPLVGSPQDTFCAWRIGGQLGIERADDALWAYRALTADRGWWRRWQVREVIRQQQLEALKAAGPVRLPGLVPAAALVHRATSTAPLAAAPVHQAEHTAPAAPVQSAPAAPVHQAEHTAPAAPVQSAPAAPVHRTALAAPAALVHQPAAAPVQSTPAAPGRTASSSNVTDLAADDESAREVLEVLAKTYGRFGSWERLRAALNDPTDKTITQSGIERAKGIGKRRLLRALDRTDLYPFPATTGTSSTSSTEATA